MFKRNRNTGLIGVDFGSQSVKLAQIVVRGKRIGVRAAAVVPRANPWPNDLSGLTEACSSLGELDVALTLNDQFVGNMAAAAVSMAVCDVRRISIPEQGNHPPNDIIAREFSGIERFRAANRIFDFWETDRAFSDSGPPVNVLSIPEFWSAQFLNDLDGCRLTTDVLDGVPFTMTRAFNLFEDSDEPVALLDWGYSRATFCIVHHGYPKFVRMLRKSGFRYVVDEISRSFDIDAEMARKTIQQYGIDDGYTNRFSTELDESARNRLDIQQTIHDFVLEPVNAIGKEIIRTINFLHNQQKALAPTRLVIFGGGATLRNIVPLLESRIRMQCDIWGEDIAVSVPGGVPLSLLANAIAMSALPLVGQRGHQTAKIPPQDELTRETVQ